MSDEKINLTPFESYTQNRLDNIWSKIEELEKVIGQKSWYKKDIGSIIDILEKEIAELKERVETFGFFEHIQEQVTELKERFAKQQENIDYNMKFLTDHINKIRDATVRDINYAHRVSEGIDKFLALSRIETIEEILRDLIQYLWREHNLFTTKYSNELLAKLEGKTEKKERGIKRGYYDSNDKFHIIKEDFGSGGEKELEASIKGLGSTPREESLMNSPANSKPPEPIIATGELELEFKRARENNERNWDGDWKEYMRKRIKKIFPNEDLVKREDLQFLFDHTDFDAYLGDDIDDMYKERRRIKEEYGIEN